MDHEHKLELWRLESQRLKLETEKLKHAEAGLKLKYEQKRRQSKSTTRSCEPEVAARGTKGNGQVLETVVGAPKEVIVIDLSESLSEDESVTRTGTLAGEDVSKDRQGVLPNGRTLRTRKESRSEQHKPSYGESEDEQTARRKRAGRQRDYRRRTAAFRFKSINPIFPTVCRMPDGKLAELRCSECSGNTSDRPFRRLKPGSSLFQHYRSHGTETPQKEQVHIEEVMSMSIHHWLDDTETAAVLSGKEQEYVVPVIMVKKMVTADPASTEESSVHGQTGAPCGNIAATGSVEEDDEEVAVLKVET